MKRTKHTKRTKRTKLSKSTKGGCPMNMRPYLDYSAYFNPTSGGGLGGNSGASWGIKANNANNATNNADQIRSFTLVDFPKMGQNYGNFIAKSPMQGAHKAFRQLLNEIKIKENQFIVFTLLDNGNHKEYQYIGTPVQLVKPVEINYDDHTKKYNYRYVISRYDGDLEDYRLSGGGRNKFRNNQKFFIGSHH